MHVAMGYYPSSDPAVGWRRRWYHHYRHFVEFCLHSAKTAQLPGWLTSTTARIVLVAVLLAVAVLYVIHVSSSATRGYAVNNLERQLVELRLEQQKLEVAVATSQSMVSIKKRLGGVAMVPAAEVVFRHANAEHTVAKR